jgi:hypothetical protein
MIIKDGTVAGYEAKVNASNQLSVFAESATEFAQSSKVDGTAFYLRSGFVPLTTTASFSGIFYVKNNATAKNVFFHSIRASGGMVQQWKLIRLPTTGTLISGGTPSPALNLNTGFATALDATVLAGADALTVTNGTDWSQWTTPAGASFSNQLSGALILAPGDALAMVVKPAAAGDVGVTMLVTQSNGS